MRALVTRVGQTWVALAVDDVREVLDAPAVTRLPGSGELEGVFALRGTVLPLWRADRLLDLTGEPHPTRCVRLAAARVHLGLLVDEVRGLATIEGPSGPRDRWWAEGSVHVPHAGPTETAALVDAAAVVARAGR